MRAAERPPRPSRRRGRSTSSAALAVEVMCRCTASRRAPDDGERFAQVLAAMYRGELDSVAGSPRRRPPSATVWEALRAKSALPATAVAVLATLGQPGGERTGPRKSWTGRRPWSGRRSGSSTTWPTCSRTGRPVAGAARCGCLLDRPGEIPGNGEDAVRRLLQSGIAAAEAQRLGPGAGRARCTPGRVAADAAASGAGRRAIVDRRDPGWLLGLSRPGRRAATIACTIKAPPASMLLSSPPVHDGPPMVSWPLVVPTAYGIGSPARSRRTARPSRRWRVAMVLEFGPRSMSESSSSTAMPNCREGLLEPAMSYG